MRIFDTVKAALTGTFQQAQKAPQQAPMFTYKTPDPIAKEDWDPSVTPFRASTDWRDYPMVG